MEEISCNVWCCLCDYLHRDSSWQIAAVCNVFGNRMSARSYIFETPLTNHMNKKPAVPAGRAIRGHLFFFE